MTGAAALELRRARTEREAVGDGAEAMGSFGFAVRFAFGVAFAFDARLGFPVARELDAARLFAGFD